MKSTLKPRSNSSTHGAYTSYIVGFGLSLIYTLTAYVLVTHRLLSGTALIVTLAGLAVAQLIVQLVFFLHLTFNPKQRWNVVAFLFMLLVLVIVVFGSLWIMQHLNYNMMSPHDTKTYLHEHEGI